MQTGKKDGMETMDAALVALVTKGLITKEEALSKTENSKLFGDSTTARPTMSH